MSLTSYQTLCANSSRAQWAVEEFSWKVFGLFRFNSPKNDWMATVAQREETIPLFCLGISVSVYMTVSGTTSPWHACELLKNCNGQKRRKNTRFLCFETVPARSAAFGQNGASWCSGLRLYPSGPQHMCLQCQGFWTIVNLTNTMRKADLKDCHSGSTRFGLIF